MDSTYWEIEKVYADSKYARVFSPSNIALAKYWGKRNVDLNLPTNGSISVTLSHFGSFTTVEFNSKFDKDYFILNKQLEEKTPKKVSHVLNLIREIANIQTKARVQTSNNFPTGAGLASSASGLSAVVFGASEALALDLTQSHLSEISRQGSGSACRSIYGGFVEWSVGAKADGTDSIAKNIFSKQHWPLKIFICVANQEKKDQPSTGGMELSRQTSPFFSGWVESAQSQLKEFNETIANKNFHRLSELAEMNCLRMHACAIASNPPILYWQPKTLEIINTVWKLRKSGAKAFFTIDAGPNVVVLCDQSDEDRVHSELLSIKDLQILSTEIGDGSRKYNATEWNKK